MFMFSNTENPAETNESGLLETVVVAAASTVVALTVGVRNVTARGLSASGVMKTIMDAGGGLVGIGARIFLFGLAGLGILALGKYALGLFRARRKGQVSAAAPAATEVAAAA